MRVQTRVDILVPYCWINSGFHQESKRTRIALKVSWCSSERPRLTVSYGSSTILKGLFHCGNPMSSIYTPDTLLKNSAHVTVVMERAHEVVRPRFQNYRILIPSAKKKIHVEEKWFIPTQSKFPSCWRIAPIRPPTFAAC